MSEASSAVVVPPLRAAVPRKQVLIILPWYKYTNPLTAFSVMGLIDRSRTGILLNFGDAFVAHTRNTCADLFLKSGLEWMLTIDDDMVVPFGNADWFNAYTGFDLPPKFAALNALDRLLSRGKTLVGGLYFGRHRAGKPMYAEGCNEPTEEAFARKAPHDGIKPTRWVGTGCMLVHRSVFLDIEKKFPRLARCKENNTRGGQWFTSSEHELAAAVEDLHALFEQSSGKWDEQLCYRAFAKLSEARASARSNSGLGMGEDVQFCIRAAAAGHQPYVDMGLVCGHSGDRVYGPRNTRGQ